MKYWRVIAAAAALAALLSVSAGVVGGVAVGAILVRVLVAAAAFAGIAYGAVYLLEKYVPEVLALVGASVQPASTPAEDAEGGGHLDITLPEENPHAGGAALVNAKAEGELETLSEALTDSEAADARDTSGLRAESPSAASEEVDDLDAVMSADVRADSVDAAEEPTPDPVAALEPIESGGDAPPAEPLSEQTLETLEGTGATPVVDSDGLGDSSNSEVGGPRDSGATESEYGSAQEIASAIRTALSRSE